MNQARLVECSTQCADPTVHHVRRRNHVDSRRSVTQRLLYERFDGFVVQHVTTLVYQAVLPMVSVGIEGNVGDDAERRETLLQRAHRARHQTVLAPRLRRVFRFLVRCNNWKQCNRRNPKRLTTFGIVE